MRMRRRITLGAAAALAVATGLTLGAMPAQQATAAGWTTVQSYTFDGSAGATPSGWTRETGPGSNFGTGEIETMTSNPANLSLDGQGDLKITPLKDANGNWTSGRITTNRDDFAAPAGGQLKMTARIKLPAVTGAAAEGYWPAFWALGSGLRNGGTWPSIGEVDTLEQVNGNNTAYGTLHCGTNPGGPCNESTGLGHSTACPGAACSGAWHDYTVILDRSTSPEQLRWYVDGTRYGTVTSAQTGTTAWNNATHHGFFMILNVAMGGGFPNGVAGHSTPTSSTRSGSSMLVDSVQVQTMNG